MCVCVGGGRWHLKSQVSVRQGVFGTWRESGATKKRTALLLMSPFLWLPERSQVVQVVMLECRLWFIPRLGPPFPSINDENKTKANIGGSDKSLVVLLCGKAPCLLRR